MSCTSISGSAQQGIASLFQNRRSNTESKIESNTCKQHFKRSSQQLTTKNNKAENNTCKQHLKSIFAATHNSQKAKQKAKQANDTPNIQSRNQHMQTTPQTIIIAAYNSKKQNSKQNMQTTHHKGKTGSKTCKHLHVRNKKSNTHLKLNKDVDAQHGASQNS